VNSLYAEAPKKRTHTPSTATSDTTSAVPSPFRVPPSPENAKPLPSPPQVVLRTKVRKAPHQAGHLLHSAISRHFRHLHCTRVPPHLKDSPVSVEVSANLEQYITDLFHQLDPLGQGYVTREDFDALCEVLGITNVTQGRNSIEWLSSYKPRPHTPGSPLRLDRLGEARYPGVRVANNGPPPSFLWTQGPRPFWELWSARKSRRKQLNLDEFLERLLEQWAVSHGYPVQEARRLLRSKALQAAPKISEDTAKGNNVFLDKKQHDRSRLDILQRVRRGRLPTNRVNQTNGIAANRGKRMFYSDSEHRNGNGIGQNGFANGNLPHQPTQPSATRKLSRFFLRSRKDQLEQQLVEQKEEIDSLKTVVNELRSSLQLSDAQNLALQVVLKRMDKAEAQLPSSEYKVKMRKSEKQLENLITELKEMSETKYPTLPSQNYSTSSSSHDPETELSTTQVYLSSVQKELRDIACRLSQSPDVTFEDLSLTEAFDALVEAQLEIEKMRSNLEAAEAALVATQSSLEEKEIELKQARLSLSETSSRLNESEKSISHLQENRKSLLQELKAAKDVLMSSLRNVHDLEIESQKVPRLEERVNLLEAAINQRGQDLPLPRRHQCESNAFSISDSDTEDVTSRHLNQSFEGGSDDDFLFHLQEKIPQTPRPLSGRSPREALSPTGEPCRTTTPSSGHFSAGSKVSSPSPPGNQQEGACKLRRELEMLRKRHSQEQRDWREERKGLVHLVNTRGGSQEGDDAGSLQIPLVEEKIREVLAMLRSLNTMNISEEVLGKMVVEAVEQAYDPVAGEVAVFRFLAILYRSTRDYERKAANSMLEMAIEAVGNDSLGTSETSSSSSTSLDSSMPGRMATLRPRRPQEMLHRDQGFQIHV